MRTPERALLLLLPEPLERFRERALVEQIMRTGRAVAADPPRTSYARQARMPDALGAGVAHRQAKRLLKKLPDEPRAVAIFAPTQYPLARGLLSQLPGCELWYDRTAPVEPGRAAELHALAAERADLRFAPDDLDALDAALVRLDASPQGRL